MKRSIFFVKKEERIHNKKGVRLELLFCYLKYDDCY
jgi:hypothetical protein